MKNHKKTIAKGVAESIISHINGLKSKKNSLKIPLLEDENIKQKVENSFLKKKKIISIPYKNND